MASPTAYLIIPPDWSSPVTFKRSWRTGIQSGVTGAEKRAAYLSRPIRTLEFSVTAMTAAGLSYLKRTLFQHVSAMVGVPLWMERAHLTAQALAGVTGLTVSATTGLWFTPGEEIVLVGDFDSAKTYEVATIDTVSTNSISLASPLAATWPAYTEVFPVIPARLSVGDPISQAAVFVGALSITAVESYEPDAPEVTTTTSTSTTSTTTTAGA